MRFVWLHVFSLLVASNIVISDSSNCGEHCEESCCEVKNGDFQCCAYVNGVCCSDGKSCCPQGSVCDSGGLGCIYPNGKVVPTKRLSEKNGGSHQLDLRESLVGKPTVCLDRTSACPSNSTCCLMTGGSWGCCAGSDAICCPDGLHCCPHGTRCNAEKQACDPVQQVPLTDEGAQFLSLLFLTQLGQARSESDRVFQRPSLNASSPRVWNAMTYKGVQCGDHVHECPDETTCCLDSAGSYACCPFPRAVCCADKLHCCPENYDCDEELGRCVSSSASQLKQTPVDQSPSKDPILKDEQLCPDSHSRCPSTYTCCKLADDTWGCCPLAEAVCCSDGLHCCPSGYKCNAEMKTCVRKLADSVSQPPPVPRSAPQIECPDPEFRCDNGTTCCSLPNDEWACCPFPKAVCCSDQAHCCPENTTCDVEHNRCVKLPSMSRPSYVDTLMRPKFHRLLPDQKASGACQMACPSGTCCKDTSGQEACCPLPNAVCCSDGLHCCPQGMQCNGQRGLCVLVNTVEPESVPWMKKLPARQRSSTIEDSAVPKTEVAPPARNITCPDRRFICQANQTCCPLFGGGYGCCPFANATCCNDRQHCCPANTTCGLFGQCVRRLGSVQSKPPTISAAFRMQPTTRKSMLSQAIVNHRLGEPVHAEWCGNLCPNGGFCCADASGQPRRKCCPATAGVCCSDGEHCCPRGTRCLGNGQCQYEDQNVQTSFAPFLVPAMDNKGASPGFLKGLTIQSPFSRSVAAPAKPAKANVLFLIDIYYRLHAREYTVCPDMERVCGLEQQCCPSFQHRYVCAPKGAVCCPYTTGTYCPSGTICSHDGLLCEPL